MPKQEPVPIRKNLLIRNSKYFSKGIVNSLGLIRLNLMERGNSF